MSYKLTDLEQLTIAADDMLLYVAYQGKDFSFPLGLIKSLVTNPDYGKQIEDILAKFDNYAPVEHMHQIDDVSGLPEALLNRPTTNTVNNLLEEKANSTDITAGLVKSVW